MSVRKEGGIIWHTQGSGKSIVMVLLAKWILENNPNARVAIITDRDELDKQIERVFTETGETIKRTRSGRELMSLLGRPRRACCVRWSTNLGARRGRLRGFIKELESQPSQTVGEVFVFVDECHRTQSGKLHRAMKAMMPNAVFIGFTGTPLEEGQTDQPRSLRRLHPHLQIQRRRGGWRDPRPRLRSAGH
jgi:type I restriction enzyme, R subunit